jgi:hypothetical protein
MDDLLYDILTKYFKTLSYTGYKSYDVVNKILIIDFIQEITNSDLRYFITNKDIKKMQDLLYQFFGSTCEISFPTNNRPCCICICNNQEEPEPEDPDTPTVTYYNYYYGSGDAPTTVEDIEKSSKVTSSLSSVWVPSSNNWSPKSSKFWIASKTSKSVVSITTNPGSGLENEGFLQEEGNDIECVSYVTVGDYRIFVFDYSPSVLNLTLKALLK